MRLPLFFTSCCLSAVLLATGCAPVVSTHGNMLEDYQVATVTPLVDTKADVAQKLGSPTTIAPFDENTWYYIGQRMEKRAVLDPKVANEKVIRVTFNADGVVQDVTPIDNKREAVDIVDRQTQTGGNEVTVMQQLLGNLGKFNKGSNAGSGAPGL
ncbi:MAG: outer membrane protein assembly factor BamE [Pseudomonadota bacterium]